MRVGQILGTPSLRIDRRWKLPPEGDEGKPEPWTCGVCGLVREARWNLWTGDWHLDTGECERCAANAFAVDSLARARENVLRKYGLLDGVYAGMTFDSYLPDPKHPKQAVAKQVAWELVEDWRAGLWHRGLILAGTDVGIGKTHLAIAAAREGVQLYTPRPGERILAVWDVPHFLGKIKDSYDNGGPGYLMQTATESGIVILDDIGVEHVNRESWYQEIMYTIFNARWLGQKATIITTNMRSSQLRNHLGERTWSRLLSLVGIPVHITGDDHRGKEHG